MSDWQTVFAQCEHNHRALMELLEARSHATVASHKYTEKTNEIQRVAEAYRKDVERLDAATQSSAGDLTRGERSRRMQLLEAIKAKEKKLSAMAKNTTDRKQELKQDERRMLLDGGGIKDLGAVGWSEGGHYDDRDGENEAMHYNTALYIFVHFSTGDAISPYGAISTQELKMQQESELAEQDRGLDSLHDVIVRQKRIAEVIGNEVGVQNEILDDLGDNMDQTRQRLVDTTQDVRMVGRRDTSTWRYWLVIVLLAVVIVILASVPGKK